jgi:hypothetical protein
MSGSAMIHGKGSTRPSRSIPLLDIASFPHTFAASDADGTLLLRLDTLTQL